MVGPMFGMNSSTPASRPSAGGVGQADGGVDHRRDDGDKQPQQELPPQESVPDPRNLVPQPDKVLPERHGGQVVQPGHDAVGVPGQVEGREQDEDDPEQGRDETEDDVDRPRRDSRQELTDALLELLVDVPQVNLPLQDLDGPGEEIVQLSRDADKVQVQRRHRPHDRRHRDDRRGDCRRDEHQKDQCGGPGPGDARPLLQKVHHRVQDESQQEGQDQRRQDAPEAVEDQRQKDEDDGPPPGASSPHPSVAPVPRSRHPHNLTGLTQLADKL
jgi:hypothetical protein